jgi:hypothetical protein
MNPSATTKLAMGSYPSKLSIASEFSGGSPQISQKMRLNDQCQTTDIGIAEVASCDATAMGQGVL